MTQTTKVAEWILRVAVFSTFLGHGMLAISIKQSWIPLIRAFGFSENTAETLLPLIGMLDITVAFFALFWPARIILIWAILWAFAAALSYPISGEPIWEFVERVSNWVSPLALLVLQGFPKSFKKLLTIRSPML